MNEPDVALTGVVFGESPRWHEGRLWFSDWGKESDGSLVTHADLSHLAAAWNEIVVDGRGNAYVNQARFDLMAGAEPTSGTIALAPPTARPARSPTTCGFPTAWPSRRTTRP